MRLLPRYAILFLCCTLAGGACKDETAPEPANAFTAVLSGAVTDTVTGFATIGSGAGTSILRMSVSSDMFDPTFSLLIHNPDAGAGWATGTITMSTTGTCTSGTWAQLDMAGVATDVCNSGGTLVITSASLKVIAGTFTITFPADAGPVTMTGKFRAKCVASTPTPCGTPLT